MKKSLIVGIIITLLLLTGCVQQPTEAPTPTLTGEPPKTGDWIITGQQSFEDRSITLNGNLIIKRSGTLTLKGIRLLVNASFNGQYKISVEPGGSMYVYGSTITAANPEHRFAFIVSGSAFEMKDSELHGVGWGPDAELWEAKDIMSGSNGLVVTTTKAIIEGNLLSNNHVGVILAGTGINLSKNEIHSNKVHGIFIYEGRDNQITSNLIRHATVSSPFRIVRGQTNRIADNTIVSSLTRGVIETFWSNENTFENNNISGLGVGIALMFVSNSNVVKNNTISVNEVGVQVWGWNNQVENNSILETATGIYTVYAYNTVIAENVISIIGNINGIMMWHSSNNAIINNMVSASEERDRSSGLLLYSSSKNNIIQGNTFNKFPRGISVFFSSDGNTINNNEISSIFESVFIDDSSGNTVYNNNFLGEPGYDDGINKWDFEGKGNYWDKYVGTDSNGDEVGDVSYPVKLGGVDNYPLIKPIAIVTSPIPKFEFLPITDVPSTDIPTESQKASSKEIVIENQIIVLRKLVLGHGQTLTLRNVTLITGGAKEGSEILVRGGKLSIYDSKIMHMEYGNGFELWADDDATFVMKNTEVNQVGHEWKDGGIRIFTDNAVLENNLISNAPIRFSPYHPLSGGQVIGNTILHSLFALKIGKESENFTIANNTIQSSIEDAIVIHGENHIVTGNEVSDTAFGGGIVYNGNNGVIKDNHISKVKLGGIVVHGNNNTIANNVTSDNGGDISVEGDNNQVFGNR